jgi:carboxypeptidase PM20D1
VKKTIGFVSIGLAVLLTVCLVRTLRLTSQQPLGEPITLHHFDRDALARRLAQALQFQTLSFPAPAQYHEEFLRFHRFLTEAFPRLSATLMLEKVGDYSLLYTWPGRDSTRSPVLLMAHQDIVPVDTPERWKYPPFAGQQAEGYIWGRGALDDKSSLLALLEAVEVLVEEGVQPQRTIYLAFGHDEEIGGAGGAAQIAAVLRARDVHLDYVVDEGMIIGEGLLPVSPPVALIGIAEKGAVSLELRVDVEGGHASMPPPHTAIGILSQAVTALENHPMPGGLRGAAAQMFETLAPEMAFGTKLAFANLWLCRRLIERRLAATPHTQALLRTTTAVTMITGGVKDNVLPTSAKAIVNFRILPGDRIATVIAHVRQVINDPRVQVSQHASGWEPTTIASTKHPGFLLLHHTIRQVFPEAVVAPALVLASTDSRHYALLTEQIYRFRPHRLRQADLKGYHGINERLSVENHIRGTQFYYQLLTHMAVDRTGE